MNRYAWPLIATLTLASVASGCVTSGSIKARPTPSKARIAIQVESGEWAFGDLQGDTLGELRALVLDKGAGLPVVDGAEADLILKVKITDTSINAVVAYEWQLIQASTGAMVKADTGRFLMGGTGANVAAEVVAALVAIDTQVYAGGNTDIILPPPTDPGPSATALGEPPASATKGDNAWAVVVGIEQYRNDLTPATGAEADARAFADYARVTLGVPEANIKLLTGQRAARSDIAGAIMEWLPRNAVAPGGRVYVFFSGHGAPDIETGDAYLVPYDADPAYLKTGGVSVAEVNKALGGLKGQQTFVFLDACFSGSGDRSVLAAGTRPLVPVKDVAPAGTVVTLTASGASEATGAHPTSGHGLFTHHLLTGLGGAADANRDGDVTLAELTAHISREVTVEARRQNRDQTPTAVVPSGIDPARMVLVDDLE